MLLLHLATHTMKEIRIEPSLGRQIIKHIQHLATMAGADMDCLSYRTQQMLRGLQFTVLVV